MSLVKSKVSWESFQGPGQKHEPKEFSGTQGKVLIASPFYALLRLLLDKVQALLGSLRKNKVQGGKAPTDRGQLTF